MHIHGLDQLIDAKGKSNVLYCISRRSITLYSSTHYWFMFVFFTLGRYKILQSSVVLVGALQKLEK